MSKLLIKDIEVNPLDNVIELSRKEQEMTLGGQVVIIIIVSPPPPSGPSCDPKMVGCGDQDDPARV